MRKKKLPYDFIDATVLKMDVSKGKKLRIKVQLYKLFNPKEEIITLIFNGVNETQRIFDLSRSFHQLNQTEESINCKVKNISFDAITESSEGNYNFYIEIEGIKGERISCRNYSINLPETN